MQDFTPPTASQELQAITKKPRNSNLELYRIIVMLLIVAHHYVVNSGLFEVLKSSEFSPISAAMLLFGAWGKTGINCFVLITGYFMCKSRITWEKLLKLYAQIALYTLVIFGIFCFTGHESLTFNGIFKCLWPIKSVTDGFTSCFLVFFLMIPFLNILIQNLDRRMHLRLLLLLIIVFSVLPSFRIPVSFSYVSWFCVIYIIAAYIRRYDFGHNISHKTWGWIAAGCFILGSASVLALYGMNKSGYIKSEDYYFFISDSNKTLSLIIAVTSFMWFKGIKMSHHSLINIIGGTTFGVLLIHANSNAMRQWLWRETVDCTGHFSSVLWSTVLYAVICVLLIFMCSTIIDWFRVRFLEPWYMRSLMKVSRYSLPFVVSFANN